MKTILASTLNRYGGRWIELYSPVGSMIEAATFSLQLKSSVEAWQNEGVKVVWLPIPSAQAHLIKTALTQGFLFHHTKGDMLTLTKRLVNDAIIPDFANHTLGTGAVVFNGDNQVLMVVEKHDMKDRPKHWKLPGGIVDCGELIRDAVVRETLEETGIQTKFERFVGMRHYHKGQFGTSNIYVLCRLRALSVDIKLCPEEIGKAEWFDVDTYLEMDSVLEFNKVILHAALYHDGMPDVNLGLLHDIPCDEYEIFCNVKTFE